MGSGLDVLSLMIATVRTVNPSFSKEDTATFVMDILDTGVSKTINGIEYGITNTEQMGTWLTIEPVK